MTLLDGIFDQIATIEEKPESKHKARISILLTPPSDHSNLLEIQDIQVSIEGLKDSKFLEVGSWIRKDELKDLKNKNKGVKFVFGVV